MAPSMFVSEKTIAAIVELAGLATPMALRVAVTPGLPDRLRGDGADVEQVATELHLSAFALDVLLSPTWRRSGSFSWHRPATEPPNTERCSAARPTTD